MVLARSVYDGNGQVVMREGTAITASTGERLGRLRIPLVCIEDPRFDDLDVRETVSFELVRQVLEFRRASRNAIVANRRVKAIELDVEKARSLAESIEEEILDSAADQLNLVQYLPAESYWDAQAINGAILAGRLARTLGMDRDAVRELILVCLAHDLSLSLLPGSVQQNLGRLSDQEKKALFMHPRLDAEILHNQQGVSAVAVQALGQHHELWNGSGYPRRLKGEDIAPMARIVVLVDAYAALVGERPNRQRLMPHEAIEYVMGYAGEYFEMNTVEKFARAIPSYFTGIMVKLSNGQKGVVTYPNIGEIARPKVRLLTDPMGAPLQQPRELDLSSPGNASLLIAAVIDE